MGVFLGVSRAVLWGVNWGREQVPCRQDDRLGAVMSTCRGRETGQDGRVDHGALGGPQSQALVTVDLGWERDLTGRGSREEAPLRCRVVAPSQEPQPGFSVSRPPWLSGSGSGRASPRWPCLSGTPPWGVLCLPQSPRAAGWATTDTSPSSEFSQTVL